MAPERMTLLFTMAMPRKMGSPRPPAPMRAAKVAVPMLITVDVRMQRCKSGNWAGVDLHDPCDFRSWRAPSDSNL